MERAVAGNGCNWEQGQDGDTDCSAVAGQPWGDPGAPQPMGNREAQHLSNLSRAVRALPTSKLAMFLKLKS